MAEMITLICSGCQKVFDRRMKIHRQNLKANKPPYCSRACFHANKGPYKKANPSVEVKCEVCEKLFKKPQCRMNITSHNFCSLECCGKFQQGKPKAETIDLKCPVCKQDFSLRLKLALFRKKTRKNLFCSRPCMYDYIRQNPCFARSNKGGRSKLEHYIEKKLREEYPSLEILFNSKYSGFELDIYFPSLCFAVEINGIWHYEPIKGEPLLVKIQNRDKIKAKICENSRITLFVMPVLEPVKNDRTFDKYWQIVKSKLTDVLQTSPVGFEPTIVG